MAKDYAKKSKKKTSASRFKESRSSNTVPGWIWLLAGLSIGVILMVILRSNLFSSTHQATIIETKDKPISAPASAKTHYKAVPAEETDESEFSFYNELENKVVEIPAEENLLPQKIVRKVRTYIMQCGSFKQKSAAETLKAKIALTGFSAHIKSTLEKSGTRWFRVSLGPYKRKRVAEKERHQLERNNINNCQIW